MPDAETEAEWIVTRFTTNIGCMIGATNDFAILFRMNAQSRIFEEQFRELEIPYKLIGGQSFYERREVKERPRLSQRPSPTTMMMSASCESSHPLPAVSVAERSKRPQRFRIERQSSVYDALQDIEFQASLPKRAQKCDRPLSRIDSAIFRIRLQSECGLRRV